MSGEKLNNGFTRERKALAEREDLVVRTERLVRLPLILDKMP